MSRMTHFLCNDQELLEMYRFLEQRGAHFILDNGQRLPPADETTEIWPFIDAVWPHAEPVFQTLSNGRKFLDQSRSHTIFIANPGYIEEDNSFLYGWIGVQSGFLSEDGSMVLPRPEWLDHEYSLLAKYIRKKATMKHYFAKNIIIYVFPGVEAEIKATNAVIRINGKNPNKEQDE